jgi:Region found in RelA / SpoT proteins
MHFRSHQSAVERYSTFTIKIEDLIREIVVQNNIPYYRIESTVEHHHENKPDDAYVPVIRVVTYFEDTVSKISNILRDELDVDAERSIDKKNIRVESFSYKHINYSASLKANRRELTEYKRLGDKKFEIQICSMLQDAWSGIEKELGYDNSAVPDEAKRDFYRVGALLEMADIEFLRVRTEHIRKREEAEAMNVAAGKPQSTFAEHLQTAAQVVATPQPIVEPKIEVPAPVSSAVEVPVVAAPPQAPKIEIPAIAAYVAPKPAYEVTETKIDIPAVVAASEPAPVPLPEPVAPVLQPEPVAVAPVPQPAPIVEAPKQHASVFNTPIFEEVKEKVQEKIQEVTHFFEQQPKAAPVVEAVAGVAASIPGIDSLRSLAESINNVKKETPVPQPEPVAEIPAPAPVAEAIVPVAEVVQPAPVAEMPAPVAEPPAPHIVPPVVAPVTAIVDPGIAEKIADAVREQITDKNVPFYDSTPKPTKTVQLDENAPITDVTLREYVMNSKLLKEVDTQIAERAGAKINPEIDIEGDVERLRFLKVYTLKQLHERISDNKDDIVAFAEKWIGKDNGGSFDSGICLFYLEYLLVGKRNDPAFAVEYVVKFISDNDYSARYIIPTYNSIRNSEAPNFSHLTLKA